MGYVDFRYLGELPFDFQIRANRIDRRCRGSDVKLRDTRWLFLVLLALVGLLFGSCDYNGKEGFLSLGERFPHSSYHARAAIRGEAPYNQIPLSVAHMEGQTKIVTSPNGRITISESIVIEEKNAFGGSTSFEKLNLTTSAPLISKYQKVHKDHLNRTIVLEVSSVQPEGRTLERQVTNFEPTVIYYSFFGGCGDSCAIPDMIVMTTWINDHGAKNEVITLASKHEQSFSNGNTEYSVQKGFNREALTCTHIYLCYKEIAANIAKKRNERKPILDIIVKSFKEIKNRYGNTVIIVSGAKIDSVTGFPKGNPRYLEFHFYAPPFRIITLNEIEARVQEIERELDNRNGKEETGLAHIKKTEYIREERGLLEQVLKDSARKDVRHLVVYLPEILFFHAGIMSCSYTYEYDASKGTQAHSFVGVEK